MDTVTYRPAAMDDIPAMTRLLNTLFSIEADFEPDEERQRLGLTRLMLQAQSAHVVVAERGGDVVGMCTVQVLISTAEGGRVGLVEDVVVREECRRLGIGRGLLAQMEQWAKGEGLSRLQLLVDDENEKAKSFYKALSWKQTRLSCLRRIPDDGAITRS